MRYIRLVLILIFLGLLAGCDGDDTSSTAVDTGDIPDNAIQISIIYAPESDLYMPETIAEFNRAYATGKNPLTGEALASGEKPIYVIGEAGSSGTVMQGIINAIIAPNNRNVAKPTIFAPSVSHWLALANYQSGREIFNLSEAEPTALAPVVMAIWESRLRAIRDTVGYDDIGWEELLDVLGSENGWIDYGIAGGRRTVYYGHTDPFVSSTALSTLIAEFYASAQANGYTERRLTQEMVDDEVVQQGVRDIEQLIRHYSSRTTEFKEYIAKGPQYLDFVALEENDLIYINRGLTATNPPEPLVALYPKEGTFWHEHPFGIMQNVDWVTAEQQAAARIFTQYVLTEPIQQRIMEQGFRPANPNVQLGFPFVEELGVTTDNASINVLSVPADSVIASVQQNWAFVKKQADIMLLIDVSGSMQNDGKLDQAKQAAVAFIENMESTNRVGLSVFSEGVRELVPLDQLEVNRQKLINQINNLEATGGTELFAAVQSSVQAMTDTDDSTRIRAVVILSDGEDTGSQGYTLDNAIDAIALSRDSLNPVIVIPVAYGADADIAALNSIARSSSTSVQSGDPQNILTVLEIISSFF